MKMNGKAWQHNYINHSDLVNGANIVFDMTARPDTVRGTKEEDKPYSLTAE